MAPRSPESRQDFIARLRERAAAGDDEIRFGRHHFTHAACREDDVWRIRRLEFSQADADAFREEHGMFMPENAEAISKPTTLVLEAASLDDLVSQILDGPWPL